VVNEDRLGDRPQILNRDWTRYKPNFEPIIFGAAQDTRGWRPLKIWSKQSNNARSKARSDYEESGLTEINNDAWWQHDPIVSVKRGFQTYSWQEYIYSSKAVRDDIESKGWLRFRNETSQYKPAIDQPLALGWMLPSVAVGQSKHDFYEVCSILIG